MAWWKPEPGSGSASQQRIRSHCIRAEIKSREGFHREGEGDAEIVGTCEVSADAESEGGGPGAEVTVDGVSLLIHSSFANVITMRCAKAPILVEPVEERAREKAAAFTQIGRQAIELVAK